MPKRQQRHTFIAALPAAPSSQRAVRAAALSPQQMLMSIPAAKATQAQPA
jgi:hypothetical protein